MKCPKHYMETDVLRDRKKRWATPDLVPQPLHILCCLFSPRVQVGKGKTKIGTVFLTPKEATSHSPAPVFGMLMMLWACITLQRWGTFAAKKVLGPWMSSAEGRTGTGH